MCANKIQISLRIRAVWSESFLDAFWIAKATTFLYADSEDSDQTHYENTPNQIFWNIHHQKLKVFR